jgi:hypothetical protein
VDGELRKLFTQHLRTAQWTPIETGMTMQGVPDSEYYFPGGAQGWVEHKRTEGWRIAKSKAWPFQVAWISRRVRLGGRAFVAVRRKRDELWLVPGSEIRQLADRGLGELDPLKISVWLGGPTKWDWVAVEAILRGVR